jgi:hypothetical protein
MKFKKGSIEAKRFMAKLRAAKGKKKISVSGVKKKTSTKKPVVKKLHKDTKSHNVNIKVVSGTKNNIQKSAKIFNEHYDINYKEYKKYKQLLEESQELLKFFKYKLKNEWSVDERRSWRHDIKVTEGQIKEYKYFLNYHKKHLNSILNK